MDIFTAWSIDAEGVDLIGVAATLERAKQICDDAEREIAEQFTKIGEVTINADRSITRTDRVYTYELVWKDDTDGSDTTRKSKLVRDPYGHRGYSVTRQEVLD